MKYINQKNSLFFELRYSVNPIIRSIPTINKSRVNASAKNRKVLVILAKLNKMTHKTKREQKWASDIKIKTSLGKNAIFLTFFNEVLIRLMILISFSTVCIASRRAFTIISYNLFSYPTSSLPQTPTSTT